MTLKDSFESPWNNAQATCFKIDVVAAWEMILINNYSKLFKPINFPFIEY